IVHSGDPPRTIQLPVADAGWSAISPDGTLVATTHQGVGTVQIWDARNRKALRTLPVGGTPEFSTDGRWLMVWSDPGELYAVGTWKKQRRVSSGIGVLAADGRWLARADGNGTIYLERLEDGRELGRIPSPEPGALRQLLLTRDGSRLIAIHES